MTRPFSAFLNHSKSRTHGGITQEKSTVTQALELIIVLIKEQ